jgi:hypothetical protein
MTRIFETLICRPYFETGFSDFVRRHYLSAVRVPNGFPAVERQARSRLEASGAAGPIESQCARLLVPVAPHCARKLLSAQTGCFS